MAIQNDNQAAALISKSRSGKISPDEQRDLDDYLARSDASTDYDRFIDAIESSAASNANNPLEELSETIDSTIHLSELSKERMRRSVQASERAAEGSSYSIPSNSGGHLQVADANTEYYTGANHLDEEPETLEAERRVSETRFTLLQMIGEGGLGTVWLARDEKLGRNVALKELNEKAAKSAKHWRRFQREAEITGHLEHPNVVPLYMSGINEKTGRPFYVMRFLGKQTLAQAIAEYHGKIANRIDEPLDLQRLLNSFLKVCEAIAYAHARGVIHRDLKPENIVLDNFGQVVVLDWGLAKLESDSELGTKMALAAGSHPDENENIFKTFDGSVIGTPLFMSPEQALGKLNEIDFKTDIYGLGAILFAILTGNAPHLNSNKSKDGSLRVESFLQAIADESTPVPSDTRSDVPRDLELICMRAMAHEKYARHTSASELASDVENWIAGRREKRARFDSMLQQGRDLRSRLCVQVRQHVATAQFMLELPPIQGLKEAVGEEAGLNGEQYAIWRERLSAILIALLKSKPSACALSYSRLKDDRIQEFVRVERSQQDPTNIRSVPQSRLRNSNANTFHKMVIEQFPGEWQLDFDCTTAGTIRIVCGIPVFDAVTEEPFGLVLAEADLGNLISPELRLIHSESHVYVVDPKDNILFSTHSGREVKAKLAGELIPNWEKIRDALQQNGDYLDDGSEVYVTTLELSRQTEAMHIVFVNKD